MKTPRFLPVLALATSSVSIAFAQTAPSPAKPAPAKPPTAKPAPGKPAPVQWKTATPAQRQAAAGSIKAQLEAFKRDDWNKAITFQSDNLRRNFQTPAQFRAVIEKNYPEFADYRSVQFGSARATGDVVQIAVKIVGMDGVRVNSVYLMHKEKGVYRIDGVIDDKSGQQPPAQSV